METSSLLRSSFVPPPTGAWRWVFWPVLGLWALGVTLAILAWGPRVAVGYGVASGLGVGWLLWSLRRLLATEGGPGGGRGGAGLGLPTWVTLGRGLAGALLGGWVFLPPSSPPAPSVPAPWLAVGLFLGAALAVSLGAAPVLLATVEAEWARLAWMVALSSGAAVSAALLAPGTGPQVLEPF